MRKVAYAQKLGTALEEEEEALLSSVLPHDDIVWLFQRTYFVKKVVTEVNKVVRNEKHIES